MMTSCDQRFSAPRKRNAPFLRRILAKFLAPSRWIDAPLNAIAAFVAMLIAESVLVRNQFNEVYPPEADSIGILLMGITFYSVIALILMLISMALVRRGPVPCWIGYILISLAAAGYLMQFGDVVDPLHYEIALSQGALGLLLLGYLYLEVRRQRRGDAYRS